MFKCKANHSDLFSEIKLDKNDEKHRIKRAKNRINLISLINKDQKQDLERKNKIDSPIRKKLKNFIDKEGFSSPVEIRSIKSSDHIKTSFNPLVKKQDSFGFK